MAGLVQRMSLNIPQISNGLSHIKIHVYEWHERVNKSRLGGCVCAWMGQVLQQVPNLPCNTWKNEGHNSIQKLKLQEIKYSTTL